MSTSNTRQAWNWGIGGVRNWIKRNTSTVGVIVVALIVWEIYARTDGRSSLFLPSVSDVIRAAVANSDRLINGLRVTLIEVWSGFLIGAFMGIALGIFFAEFRIARDAFLPSLVFSYSLPHAIVAPLFVVWFGLSLKAVALFTAWFAFFALLINTITGITQTEEEFMELGEVVGASRWQMVKKIKFWNALPYISNGLKVAMQQAMIGVILAEFIVSGGGLGFIILLSNRLLKPDLMLAAIFLTAILAMVLYQLITVIIDFLGPGPGQVSE